MAKIGRTKIRDVYNSTKPAVRIDSAPLSGSTAPLSGLTAPASPIPANESAGTLKTLKVLKGEGGGPAAEQEFEKEPKPPSPPRPESETRPDPPDPAATLRTVCTRWGIDRSGMRRLVDDCREAVRDVTYDEIAHFADQLARKKRAEGDTRPLSGILISKTPDILADGIEAHRAGLKIEPEATAYTELPPPCARCRDLEGWIIKQYVRKSGIFAGTVYPAIAPCTCDRGRALRAGHDRSQAESPRRENFKGFRSLKEVANDLFLPADDSQTKEN